MWHLLAASDRELNAWNVGVILAFLACVCWWRSDGRVWFRELTNKCRGCGRAKENCSCVDVTFTPDDWGDE